MPDQQETILIIEDDGQLLKAYVKRLNSSEYSIDTAEGVEDARTLVAHKEYAVILTDLMLEMNNEGGLEILRQVKRDHPDTQVIIFTGVGGTDDAREARRLGASTYFTKPLDFTQVREAINRGILTYRDQQSMREEFDDTPPSRKEYTGPPTPEPLLFYAEPMQTLVQRATRLFRTSENILIIGEPGTGKSLLAEGIHRGSGRKGFELLNCSGLSDVTLEPMLFGSIDGDGVYVSGLLERLKGGTLLLDRVSGLRYDLQDRLRKALEARAFQPYPNADAVPIDVRIIAIDEGDLEQDVAQNLFSPELYRLLSRAVLHVPPLRARVDANYNDVVLLAEEFIARYGSRSQLDAETAFMFTQYPFPGNVAEMDRVIRRALGQVKENSPILPEHLPARMQRYGIRPGLGSEEADTRVLCPHGPFICDRVATISSAHRSQKGVYLRMGADITQTVLAELEKVIRQMGMTPLPVENIPDALTQMCKVCVPAQASHFAIVDLEFGDPQRLYEIGLLHALGTPTLLIQQAELPQSVLMEEEAVLRYERPDELIPVAHGWLRELMTGSL